MWIRLHDKTSMMRVMVNLDKVNAITALPNKGGVATITVQGVQQKGSSFEPIIMSKTYADGMDDVQKQIDAAQSREPLKLDTVPCANPITGGER